MTYTHTNIHIKNLLYVIRGEVERGNEREKNEKNSL